LILGLTASRIFNATYLIDALLRPDYNSVRFPMSALSLGSGGWVQMTNFVAARADRREGGPVAVEVG
jgi:hypothetical protein